MRDGEYRDMKDVETELRFEAINNKKAEKIIAQLKNAKTLEEAAQLLGNNIEVAEGVSMGGYRFGAAGVEPAVIGAAMKLAEGEVSAPIKGVNGVYMVKGAKQANAGETFDADAQIQQLNMRTAYSLPYQALALIEENAEVEDNRANFQ